MELLCDICFASFDLVAHRPKSLPCGHTICKDCVQNPDLGRKCPTCRKDLVVDPGDLPDNNIVIRLIENDGAPARKKPKREDQEVQQLQRGVNAGKKVVELLRLAVPKAVEALNRQLDTSVAQLRQLEEALEQQAQRIAAGDVDTPPEQLQLALKLEESLRLLTTNKCSIVTEEDDGSTWQAAVDLEGCGDVLRLLLLQLREDGQMENVHDLTGPSSPAAYVGPPMLAYLTINENDLAGDNLKVNQILRDKRRLGNIRCIKGLHGNGSDKLLRVVASHPLHIEELGFLGEVEPKAMEEVQRMASLKRLDVKCFQDRDDYPDLPLQLEELAIDTASEQQLDCVMRMPALQCLRVWSYHGANLTFPPSQYGTLRWLCVALNSEHKPTMLSLIRAHASSLQELHVYCTISDGGFHYPDLGRDLAACRLQHLQRLVLERPKSKPCADVAVCLMQLQSLRGFLLSSVEVTCGACPASALG